MQCHQSLGTFYTLNASCTQLYSNNTLSPHSTHCHFVKCFTRHFFSSFRSFQTHELLSFFASCYLSLQRAGLSQYILKAWHFLTLLVLLMHALALMQAMVCSSQISLNTHQQDHLASLNFHRFWKLSVHI